MLILILLKPVKAQHLPNHFPNWVYANDKTFFSFLFASMFFSITIFPWLIQSCSFFKNHQCLHGGSRENKKQLTKTTMIWQLSFKQEISKKWAWLNIIYYVFKYQTIHLNKSLRSLKCFIFWVTDIFQIICFITKNRTC